MTSVTENVFRDTSITLTRDGNNESTLYIDYNYEAQAVRFSIYSEDRELVFDKEAHYTYVAARILNELAAEYPGKIKKKQFLPAFDLFFTAVENAVFEQGPLYKTTHCGQCGNHDSGTFRFLCIPAIPDTKLHEGAVELDWDYGCYNNVALAGTVEDTAAEVRDHLERMNELAEFGAVQGVQNALNALTRIGA